MEGDFLAAAGFPAAASAAAGAKGFKAGLGIHPLGSQRGFHRGSHRGFHRGFHRGSHRADAVFGASRGDLAPARPSRPFLRDRSLANEKRI
jgi:hypothetical protein